MAHADARVHAGARVEEGTRSRILRAAALLFHTQGFERTSMQAVAAAVGIQKSSLYHHFRSKDEILFEILRHTVDAASGGLEAIAAAPRPAADRLRMAVRHHVTNLVADLDNVACFVEEGKALPASYRESYVVKRDRYEQFFRMIIADGIRAGEFAPTDVRLAGFAVLGMCNWMVRWYHPDGSNTPDEIAVALGEYAVGALRGGVIAPVPAAARAAGESA